MTVNPFFGDHSFLGLFAVICLLCLVPSLVALVRGGQDGDLLINDEHQRLLDGAS